ncbi:MAG: hypothetical protein ACI8QZ_001508 [Chlamydiales bacterium]|jgi:hypothetical protein
MNVLTCRNARPTGQTILSSSRPPKPVMSTPEPPADPPQSPQPTKSYGNMSEHHWSRTRGERNKEALDYYRERSTAPGVRDGGGPRNFYCMECDGVVPHDIEAPLENCPHCGVSLEGETRRYFNWVEIDTPPASDLRALLPWIALVGLVALALVALAWALLRN